MSEKCNLCGEPMPEGETMFNYHGYSGPCPKPPMGSVGSATDERTTNNMMRHQYRVLTEDEKTAMLIVKDSGAAFLAALDGYCNPGRETALAKTKIEEAVMWAVKGITG